MTCVLPPETLISTEPSEPTVVCCRFMKMRASMPVSVPDVLGLLEQLTLPRPSRARPVRATRVGNEPFIRSSRAEQVTRPSFPLEHRSSQTAKFWKLHGNALYPPPRCRGISPPREERNGGVCPLGAKVRRLMDQLKFDEKGLIPVVAQDRLTGE